MRGHGPGTCFVLRSPLGFPSQSAEREAHSDADRLDRDVIQSSRVEQAAEVMPTVGSFAGGDGTQFGRQQPRLDEVLAGGAASVGSRPIHLSDADRYNDEVAKWIRLPEDHVVATFVAIGKGTKEARPRVGKLSSGEVVITDRL